MEGQIRFSENPFFRSIYTPKDKPTDRGRQ